MRKYTSFPARQCLASGQQIPTRSSRRVAQHHPLAFALALSLGTTLLGAPTLADAAGRPGQIVASSPARPTAGSSTQGFPTLWVVENCNDSGPGSLRNAAAHALDGDGIDLSSLTCSTISVSSGAISLSDVDLTGPGADALTIDGGGNQGQRIFNHAGSNDGALRMHGVTVHGGKYLSNAGQGGACLRSTTGQLRIYDSVFDGCIAFAPSGSSAAVRGGAIASYGTYTQLSNVRLSNNQARSANGSALGGAIYVNDTYASITDSTITNNSATSISNDTAARGGGIFTQGGSSIARSTIDGNVSEGAGGGAWIESGGSLIASTVSNNVSTGSASGIGFGSRNWARVYRSTFYGNETQASTMWGSGALYMKGHESWILDSTIAGNIESNTQGVAHASGVSFAPDLGDDFAMWSTIVHGNHLADSTAGADISGPLDGHIGGGRNLVGVAYIYMPGDTLRFVDPMLGPLQNNGGPTKTRMPASGSPAIDQGYNSGDGLDPRDVDQRGFPRIVGFRADIGSVEVSDELIFADGFE
ncbi:MAG TPA: choice-of-anchor Q domain-containing protein [Rhodanobacteraceae bacterium]|nr:choice-of-anchor Q domain-containing protein [Rhodanobacteraceae bacterium]